MSRLFWSLMPLAAMAVGAAGATDPLALTFNRRAVRRFVLSNNLPLSQLVPAEVVELSLMHPARGPRPARYTLSGGRLTVGEGDSTLWVGGAQPFATYQVDIEAVTTAGPAEVAIDLATLDLSRRVQVVARYGVERDGLLLRLVRDGQTVREEPLSAEPAPAAPCTLSVQLAGCSVSAFATRDGVTTYLGHTADARTFADILDVRDRRLCADLSFGVATRLPANAQAVIGGARSFLSAGVGQADIRMITHRDGSPYWDEGRLWFTFSCRGLNIADSCQGVLSLNPTLFDPRLEGIILYDRGDGKLRNDYSSHVFYDDEAGEWRSFCCLFSRPDRGPSGMATGRSKRDPRRGISVMRETVFTGVPGQHEDPCVVYDAQAAKWRLLTCRLEGMRAMLFESDTWDGEYKLVAGPVDHNSTGCLIQTIGDRRYVFSGSSDNAIHVYGYPDLKPLGDLKMDLPPWLPKGNARVWPNLFPLPPGGTARYGALMMDRPNFPAVKGPNWSYGALHYFEAFVDDPFGLPYEFEKPAE